MEIHSESLYKNVKSLNSLGFTLLEMLFSFSIFCLTASFLPLFFNIVLNQESVEARNQRLEWEVFISQLKREVQMSDQLEVVKGELVLLNHGDAITIQKYGTLLRRVVNKEGHEVILQNVASVQFEKRNNGVMIRVVDIYNHEYSAVLYPFVYGESGHE